jgi:hypothetical protein
VGERPLFVQHAEVADRQRAAPVQVVPAGYRFAVVVPVRTIGQNAREHFRVKAARVKAERHMVRLMLNARAVRCPLQPPLVVTLTRLSSARMDSDGVVGAMKSVRDEVAAYLGIDDRHDDLVEYRYAQERCARGNFYVRIEIARRA